MKKTGILFLVSSAKHTGPARVALLHARLLKEAGYDVHFCAHAGGTLQTSAESAGVWHNHKLALSTRGGVWTMPLDIMRIRSVVREYAIRAIFVYRSAEHLLAGLAVGKRYPIIRFVHNALPVAGDPSAKSLNAGGWWLLRRGWTQHILTPDPSHLPLLLDHARRWTHDGTFDAQGRLTVPLAEWFEKSRNLGVEFSPGGVDTIHFNPDRGGVAIRRELGLRDEHVVVGMVSRIKPGRGHDLFLKAFAKASASAPQLRALLIGEGSNKTKRPVQEQAETLSIADKVAIFAPGARYEEALAALDIGFIAHPGSAGTASAALEMMSMARPVVMLPVGVLAFLPGPRHDCALAVPPELTDVFMGKTSTPPDLGDATILDRIADALVRLTEDPDLRMDIGGNARERMEETFSRSVLQRQLLHLIDRVART